MKPLLKKSGLQLTFKNFRPVSNLPFISKIVEKEILSQLFLHCECNAPLLKLQLGCRRYHSTETAFLKVQSDILASLDYQEITLLVLLDLSAAFDTINHQIFLNVLENDFGIFLYPFLSTLVGPAATLSMYRIRQIRKFLSPESMKILL